MASPTPIVAGVLLDHNPCLETNRMMRSGVAVVLLPPCRLGLGRIRQAQFKDTQFQAQFKAFEALTLSVAFVLSFVYLSFSLSLTVLR